MGSKDCVGGMQMGRRHGEGGMRDGERGEGNWERDWYGWEGYLGRSKRGVGCPLIRVCVRGRRDLLANVNKFLKPPCGLLFFLLVK